MHYYRFARAAAVAVALVLEFGCSLTLAGKAAGQSPDAAVAPPNVVLVTLDGLRWQEVFGGADARLLTAEAGAKNVTETSQRFLGGDATQRRSRLMPFLWSTVDPKGVIYGDPADGAPCVVTNSEHFSYPGYSELLCGFADPKIDSNAKTYNANTTVLEWLNGQTSLTGRVAAFCSWDVFPFIINDGRSGVLVNAGWQNVATTVPEGNRVELQQLDTLAAEIPHLWEGVRYDYFTFKAAETYLRVERPRVLFVSFGETDDWAHEGRYDLYLESAYRNDDYIRRLWETMQSIEQYRDNTTLIITTDHGRGDTREQWKSHSKSIPGCNVIWIAAMGPAVQASQRMVATTQSQVAATVAASIGHDFTATNPSVAKPLPWVSRE